ncbi:hypothetical protein SNOG_02632 [Parastagonospora nodorum SN15]|uniref:Uncharacterized protein n=1 Tax=Phaeosphaeria nodorum (strain SN15 / ATCC MYA-4574 / FGSC 10173) TaxID=321614 RepID=Q0V032_PHANO|nr:hypothetical protein SNOG_02632 [Parastagonospora nodorum SN15]EAT89363.1 hypothetical protein SNOG_02632 [Parastagonospora nodorum SN15]
MDPVVGNAQDAPKAVHLGASSPTPKARSLRPPHPLGQQPYLSPLPQHYPVQGSVQARPKIHVRTRARK